MANPWMDDEKAAGWQPTGKPGQVHREDALAVVLRLLAVHEPKRILDLGCGIGDIDVRLLGRFPDADLVAIDAAPGMVRRTREALAPFGARARVLQSDLEACWEGEAAGPFDVVLASQVVHHLPALVKRELFARVRAVLAPGGLFVMNEKVRFDAALHPHHVALWDATRATHGFDPTPEGASYEDYVAKEREGGDVPDTLHDQLSWLRATGFVAAESFWQYGDKAVFAARKAHR